jgi:dihydrolipoamide dehydrogenase
MSGCIPSKALLDSSRSSYEARDRFAITVSRSVGRRIDVAAMHAAQGKDRQSADGRYRRPVQAQRREVIQGRGKVLAGANVEVTAPDGEVSVVEAGSVIIAAGSNRSPYPPAPIDDEYIVDSTGALEFTDVPGRLGVIGAGVIGLELGSVWGRLGAEVILLEALDEFLPMMDAQIAKEAGKIFRKQGLDIRLGCRVTEARVGWWQGPRDATPRAKRARGGLRQAYRFRRTAAANARPARGRQRCHPR